MPPTCTPSKQKGWKMKMEGEHTANIAMHIHWRVTHARRSNFQVQLASSMLSHKLAIFIHLLFKMLQILAWKWGRC